MHLLNMILLPSVSLDCLYQNVSLMPCSRLDKTQDEGEELEDAGKDEPPKWASS